MAIRERDLEARLRDEDDAVVESALREHFLATSHESPLAVDWCPVPTMVVVPDEDAGPPERVGPRLMDLANAAERLLRRRKFAWRRRRHPDWPIVLCEGDSWVAHPFVHDITDHLLNEDRYAYNVLSLGAAGDRIASMEDQAEFEAALTEHPIGAVLLSGGGNDMLAGYRVLLDIETPVDDPEYRFIVALEPHMRRAMATLRRVLGAVRSASADVPIVVHGYDYLRAGPPGKGRFVGKYLDHLGIEQLDRRAHVIRCLVDRFNHDVATLAAEVPGTRYVDLRGVVPDDHWADEIHPNKKGFAEVAEKIAAALDAVMS